MRAMGRWGRRVATCNSWTLTPEHLRLIPAQAVREKTAPSVLSSIFGYFKLLFYLKKSITVLENVHR